MALRYHLDRLRVTGTRRVELVRPFAGWSCTRCGEEHAPSWSWWVTFTDPDSGAFTVVLCGRCVHSATHPA